MPEDSQHLTIPGNVATFQRPRINQLNSLLWAKLEEGRGEEERFVWKPLSPALSPLVSRGEREADAT